MIQETNDLPASCVTPSSPVHVSSPPQASSDPPPFVLYSPLPPSSPPIYADDYAPEFETMAGPYLPGDDPDLIYDDYSGAWGAEMPHQNDNPETTHKDDRDELIHEDLDGLDDEIFEGWSDNEGDGYFGSLHEPDDLAKEEGIPSSDPDDWWPWENREASIYEISRCRYTN
jgi:hypothetical protein